MFKFLNLYLIAWL